MSAVFVVFLLLGHVSAQPAPVEAGWPTSETQHFLVHHEGAGANLAGYSRVEQIFATLHPSLWSLVPWIATEKTHVYLYLSPDSYRRGRFKPPPWSGGLFTMADGERAIAVYEPLDTTITAHELTHLYFHSYFDEKGVQPPAWLDEGLACVLQNDALGLPDPRYKGPVLRSPAPLAGFFKSRPGPDMPQAWVGVWYKQAESVVFFLKRGHNESSFAEFCGKLRDGADTETALREVYGYPDIGAFERAWASWRPKSEPGQLVDLGRP